ncbi:hypothetical protein ACF06W_11830 [Streptomyces albus]|uniref:hypothetical protein n=1 Tax=Streptomyces albus TaxID=1888 RepID=UPI0036F4FFEA
MAKAGVTQRVDEMRVKEVEAYRLAILTHLTSWLEDVTEVKGNPEESDSASIAGWLRQAVDRLSQLEPKPEEDEIGADGALMLRSAAHLMFRASQYAGSEQAAEWRCVRAASTALDEASRDFASWGRYVRRG